MASSPRPRGITPATLKQWLHDGAEIALLDVREHGQFGESHLFYAVPLPYSRLELDAPRLVPRRATRTVLVDDGSSGVAERAAQRLAALGYGQVHVLDGGTAAWSRAGFVLFQGVNLPSKTFGELVEHTLHTPRIGARELARRQAAGENLVVLDGRPYAEFAKMNIPGARCCPNGELALRIGALAPDPQTTVVVNCAGRTRSIIGAQTLIDFGVPNPVFALENGTQGWHLADLPLQHGGTARHDDNPRPADLEQRRERAARLAQRHGVATLDAATLKAWLADPSRSTFVLDVRTPEEFAAGTLAGARHAPGGQLLQATDQYVGVRGARLVLVDSDGVRAPVVASWLRRMGHETCVLAGGIDAPVQVPAPAAPALAALGEIGAQALWQALADGMAVAFDLRPSMEHRRLHPQGAQWSIRPRVVADARVAGRPVVLIGETALARCAAIDLLEAGVDVRLLHGGFAAWLAEGLPVQARVDRPADGDCIDYLFFVHDRHDGNKEAARRYLAWETGLLAQLDADERAAFRIGAP